MADAKIKYSELITGTRDQVQGVEASLLRRRRLGRAGMALGLIGAVLQVVGSIVEHGYFDIYASLVKAIGQSGLDGAVAVPTAFGGLAGSLMLSGTVLLVIGLLSYFLLRWTRFLQQESREPFRYTVSLEPFNCLTRAPLDGFELKNGERLELLHYDLRTRLQERIGRFSLVEAKPGSTASGASPVSGSTPESRRSLDHLHIAGDYLIRQDRQGHWLVHVMPTVRLGASDAPLTMGYPVEYILDAPGEKRRRVQDRDAARTPPQELASAGQEATGDFLDLQQNLDPARYEQIVERVYSSVATVVYRKIDSDVRAKIDWFPTRYLKAVALFHEARDMALSNTVAAYDRALDLYRLALRHFDVALWGEQRRRLVKLPVFWRTHAHYLQMRARVNIGYVRCRIYRQLVALQSGRQPNPIYECVPLMKRVIEDLEGVDSRFRGGDPRVFDAQRKVRRYFTAPRDRFLRLLVRAPLEPENDRQRSLLFDAYSTAALAYAVLDGTELANACLTKATNVDPQLGEIDPIHRLAKAQIESDLGRMTRLLREATNLQPSLQIAQFRLAQAMESQFRDQDELSRERAENVIQQYDEVLRVNPGNIAAVAAKGYLYWLTGRFDEAERCFREGIAFKSIARETSITDLNYGLARVLAEKGRFDQAFDSYQQAIAGDPGVATCLLGPEVKGLGYYTRIGSAVLTRYTDFRTTVDARARAGSGQTLGASDAAVRAVRDFVLNDLANAQINAYFRCGDALALDAAVKALETLCRANPDNAVAHFNLATAYDCLGVLHPATTAEDSQAELQRAWETRKQAAKSAPAWRAARLLQIEFVVNQRLVEVVQQAITESSKDRAAKADELAELGAPGAALPDPGSSFQTSGAAANRPAGSQSTPIEPSGSNPGLQDEERRSAADRRSARIALLNEQVSQLRTLEDRLVEKLQATKEEQQKNLNEAVEAITDNFKLAALLPPALLSSNDANWVSRANALIRDEKLRWELLDEGDVRTLRLLVEIATRKSLARAAETGHDSGAHGLEECARLTAALDESCLYENLDLWLLRREIGAALADETQAGDQQGPLGVAARAIVSRADDAIRHTVRKWQQEDPWHFWLLKRWFAWLDPAPYFQQLAAQPNQSRSASASCRNLVAEYLYQQVERMRPEPDKDAGGERERLLQSACATFLSCAESAPSVARYRFNAGRARALQQRWGEALAAFEEAARLFNASAGELTQDELDTAHADACSGKAAELLRMGQASAAFAAFMEAARLVPGRCSAYERLVESCAAIAAVDERRDAVRRSLALIGDALGRGQIADAELPAAERLRDRLRIVGFFGARGLARMHVVTPIAIEVAANLIGLVAKDETELSDELEQQVRALREETRLTMGVRIPGLRFRGNEGDLPPGSYVIMLSEIPLLMGTLEIDGHFYPGVVTAGPAQVEPRSARDPLTGRPGCWLLPADAERLGVASSSLMSPCSFMMRHLKAVLQDNLADFLGHSELDWMIGQLKSPLTGAGLDTSARTALVTALRSLLMERVSIAPLAEIVAAWPEIYSAQAHPIARSEALRALPCLRQRLPGKDGQRRLFLIAPKFEAALREHLHDTDRVPLLRLPPKLTQEMLAAVRQALPEDLRAEPVALLIGDAALRPHLRQLVKLEWPLAAVLAEAELDSESAGRPRTPIELE